MIGLEFIKRDILLFSMNIEEPNSHDYMGHPIEPNIYGLVEKVFLFLGFPITKFT